MIGALSLGKLWRILLRVAALLVGYFDTVGDNLTRVI